eukprot:CAMPEP_0183306088 /NCGR_PEP_ID=MMETSP0160_2-20130417/10623_1 /TAXON_ID=2839 ORGANISM="Odontella Sinensis, Strain Grunow 1884" /NCGR_SAMPLE_ID=MMETSP0160_2 /ASSEMBLY_ACC=CAM_ASM_000250 /LENGTH=239 /DNA_ID=CAMNT_0025469405 /DNA_START=292 /DNA_END=1008 /DNA_ORIENTATION=-
MNFPSRSADPLDDPARLVHGYPSLDLVPLQLPRLPSIGAVPDTLPDPYVPRVPNYIHGPVGPLVLPPPLLLPDAERTLEGFVVLEVIPAESVHGVLPEGSDVLIAVGEYVPTVAGALAVDVGPDVGVAVLEAARAVAVHLVVAPPAVVVGAVREAQFSQSVPHPVAELTLVRISVVPSQSAPPVPQAVGVVLSLVRAPSHLVDSQVAAQPPDARSHESAPSRGDGVGGGRRGEGGGGAG